MKLYLKMIGCSCYTCLPRTAPAAAQSARKARAGTGMGERAREGRGPAGKRTRAPLLACGHALGPSAGRAVLGCGAGPRERVRGRSAGPVWYWIWAGFRAGLGCFGMVFRVGVLPISFLLATSI